MFLGKYLATQLLVYMENTLFLNMWVPFLSVYLSFVLDYFKCINTIVVYFPVNLLKIGLAPLLISIFRNNMDLRYNYLPLVSFFGINSLTWIYNNNIKYKKIFSWRIKT